MNKIPQPTFPRAGTTVPDQLGTVDGLKELPRFLRQMQVQQARDIASALRQLATDPRLGDMRVGNALRTIQNNVSMDKAQAPAPGDPLSAIDSHNAKFGASMSNVDLTGQTGAITTTDLVASTAHKAGVYRVTVVAETTTASGAGAPTLTVTIGWTDDVGATTATPVGTAFSLSATGRTSGETLLYSTGAAAITYATSIAAAAGSPQYALYVRIERVN